MVAPDTDAPAPAAAEHARERLPAHLRGAGMFFVYNLWSLVPGIAAIMILVVLRQTLSLAEICPSGGKLDGNPLFCADGQVVAAMLQHALTDIRTSLAPATAPSQPQTSLRAAQQADDDAGDAKAVADAAVAQARTHADEVGAGDPDAKAAVTAALARQAEAATAAASQHRHRNQDLAAAKLASQSHAALFREARARLRWIGSYGAVVTFAIGTILAALCLWGSAMLEHVYPRPTNPRAKRRWQKGSSRFTWLQALSFLVLLTVWTLCYVTLKATVFRGMGLPKPFDPGLLHFDDAVTTFIFGQITATGGDFFPGGLALVTGANALVISAVVALGAAVAAALYQTPWQVHEWEQYTQTLTIVPKAPADTHASEPYEGFLRRCFGRLNLCIYIGATLMVVCVVHLNAQYSWVTSLLDPNATDEPWKTALPNAITGFADEVSFQYGLAFSTVLVALFLPAWVILRRRASAVACARCLKDSEDTTVQTWLEQHGMGFTSVQKYGQILALLAPAGAGIFVSVLKVLTGNNS